MKTQITSERFKMLLPSICDKETSLDPDNWTSENPLWGHCAVVALLAQDVFGGELLRASLEDTEFAEMRSHYWNRLSNGREVDFSSPQFGDKYPYGLQAEVRTRDYILFDPKTGQPREIMKRYELLRERLAQELHKEEVVATTPKSIREQVREAKVRAREDFRARTMERERKLLLALAEYYAEKWLDDLVVAQHMGLEDVWVSVQQDADEHPSISLRQNAAESAIYGKLRARGLCIIEDTRDDPRHETPNLYRIAWAEKK